MSALIQGVKEGKEKFLISFFKFIGISFCNREGRIPLKISNKSSATWWMMTDSFERKKINN